MPESGAQPEPDQDFLDVGNGVRATKYTDGSVVFWREDTRTSRWATCPPAGRTRPTSGTARRPPCAPDGSLLVYDIDNPPAGGGRDDPHRGRAGGRCRRPRRRPRPRP